MPQTDLTGALRTAANVGGNLYGLRSAYLQGRNASRINREANPAGPYRPMYGEQLATLMADPSAFENDQAYQFIRDQGLEGVERKMASQGYTGSGNMAMELAKYSSGLAATYRSEELNRLANLAGFNIAPASRASGTAARGAAFDQASSVLASMGYDASREGGTSIVDQIKGLFGGGDEVGPLGDLSSVAPGALSAVPAGFGGGAATAGTAAPAAAGSSLAAAAPFAAFAVPFIGKELIEAAFPDSRQDFNSRGMVSVTRDGGMTNVRGELPSGGTLLIENEAGSRGGMWESLDKNARWVFPDGTEIPFSGTMKGGWLGAYNKLKAQALEAGQQPPNKAEFKRMYDDLLSGVK